MSEIPHVNNDELDEDDEDGSKGEDEEVVAFDEYRDLPPSVRTKNSPTKPTAGTAPPYQAIRTGERKKGGSASTVDEPDTPELLSHVAFVTSIPWPAAAGKRPPRDMKRLIPSEWYIVCKVMKWGDTPALFVRASRDYNTDFGFYKPPAQYYAYHFQVGDRLQLSQVGYSSSRNKVATSIRVKVTHMAQVPETKLNWVPPPIQDTAVSDSKPKKKAHDDDKNGKRKKQKEEMPYMMAGRGMFGDNSPQIQSFAPLGMQQHQQHVQHQQKKEKMMYPIFQHHHSFGPGTGLANTQLMSGGNLFGFPSTTDLGLPRGSSFSFMSDLLGGSSANLMAPQSPVLGAASPMMGAPQAGMQRIPSIGGSFAAHLGSFSMNSPGAQLTMNYAFPSQANINLGEQSNGI